MSCLVPLTGYKSHHHDKVKARIHFILTLTPDSLHTYRKCSKAFNNGWQSYCHNTILLSSLDGGPPTSCQLHFRKRKLSASLFVRRNTMWYFFWKKHFSTAPEKIFSFLYHVHIPTWLLSFLGPWRIWSWQLSPLLACYHWQQKLIHPTGYH
jgi:hypothetical protein